MVMHSVTMKLVPESVSRLPQCLWICADFFLTRSEVQSVLNHPNSSCDTSSNVAYSFSIVFKIQSQNPKYISVLHSSGDRKYIFLYTLKRF